MIHKTFSPIKYRSFPYVLWKLTLLYNLNLIPQKSFLMIDENTWFLSISMEVKYLLM